MEEQITSSKTKGLVFPTKGYGTITEYYFMLAEIIHYGYNPILKRGEDVDKEYWRLMEEREKMTQSHPQYQQMKIEFENMQKFRMLYKLTIFNRDMVKSINSFFIIQFEQIKKWGNFDEKQGCLQQDPPSTILRHLPEHFLTDMTDFWKYMFKNGNDSLSYFSPDDCIKIFEMAIIIINSPKAVTNPYIGGKFIETLAMIVYFEKKKNWLNHFMESEMILEHLMEALLKFYVEIEFAGNSGAMYYEKFHYRLNCISVFKRFWKLKVFKQKFCQMVGSENMERFMNFLISDYNYCLEEGISKLKEIKAFETKIAKRETLTNEDIMKHHENEKKCEAYFNVSSKLIWMVKQTSDWAKESFNNNVLPSRMATSLNFVLNKIVGPH